MSGKCEFLKTCGFFLNYQANTEVIKHGWVRLYCKDEEKSNQCVRKKVLTETGEPPADNMCPTGKILSA